MTTDDEGHDDDDQDGWVTATKTTKRKNKNKNVKGSTTSTTIVPAWISQVREQFLLAKNPSRLRHPSQQRIVVVMVVMVGLPGAGKSSFASTLLEYQNQWIPERRQRLQDQGSVVNIDDDDRRHPLSVWVRINQDELGDRNRCIDAAMGALQQNACPIIDRCNQTPNQRRYWIDLVQQFQQSRSSSDETNNTGCTTVGIKCIYFDIDCDVCIQRCRLRMNHPTLDRYEAPIVLRRMAAELVPPKTQEGFDELIIVRNDDDCRRAFLSLL